MTKLSEEMREYLFRLSKFQPVTQPEAGWPDAVAQLEAEIERYRTALEEALPECWDTPKAERIIREALGGV